GNVGSRAPVASTRLTKTNESSSHATIAPPAPSETIEASTCSPSEELSDLPLTGQAGSTLPVAKMCWTNGSWLVPLRASCQVTIAPDPAALGALPSEM